MKSIISVLILLIYLFFSSTITHAYVMGVFENNKMIEHSCCEDGTENKSTHNLCKDFTEKYNLNWSLKEKKSDFNKISFTNQFEIISLPIHEDFLEIKLNLPPPELKRDIKNYSYITLIWQVKNIN